MDFVAVNGKRHDDFGTYVYKSTDYGATWKLLSKGVPGGPANVVKQDPAAANVLYWVATVPELREWIGYRRTHPRPRRERIREFRKGFAGMVVPDSEE